MSGELVETPWAEFNWLQYSTREMTWGARRDIITAVIMFWNWSKTIMMCEFKFLIRCLLALGFRHGVGNLNLVSFGSIY